VHSFFVNLRAELQSGKFAMKSVPPPANHRTHDYRQLIRRWRSVARASGVPMRPFAATPEHRIYYLKSMTLPARGGIYISAGIHGDEPASSEALITWAEKNARLLSTIPCLLFPCLNPWGLINNRRLDQDGIDLNRIFHKDDHPLIRAIKPIIAPHHFDVSLMLHEDYDAQGVYLYETERARPFWGEHLIRAARRIIPIDRRANIDGRKPVKPGIVRRRIDPKNFATFGFPEAIYLHLHNSVRTFTIESPSEFALDQRVSAHVAVIEECVKRILEKAP
jgi:hypothetical protein